MNLIVKNDIWETCYGKWKANCSCEKTKWESDKYVSILLCLYKYRKPNVFCVARCCFIYHMSSVYSICQKPSRQIKTKKIYEARYEKWWKSQNITGISFTYMCTGFSVVICIYFCLLILRIRARLKYVCMQMHASMYSRVSLFVFCLLLIRGS